MIVVWLFYDLQQALVGEADKLAKHGVRVRVIGDTSLLPAVGFISLVFFCKACDAMLGRARRDVEGRGGDAGQL